MAGSMIRGSTLLAAFLADDANRQSSGRQRRRRAPTGCRTIDEALGGGFPYGEITSMAGRAGVGKSLITMHAIAGHLMSEREDANADKNPDGNKNDINDDGGGDDGDDDDNDDDDVVVVDTSGNFSAARLRNVLEQRLRGARSFEHLERAVAAGLDRIKIIRVFDSDGLGEALGEVVELCDGADRRRRRRRGQRAGKEGGDGDDDDDRPSAFQARSVGMIVVDDMASIFTPELSKSQVLGHAYLAAFHRSLSSLTACRGICTILVNTAVNLGSSPAQTHQTGPEDNVSLFASTKGKPALGRSYAFLVDLSVFVSSVPKSPSDVKAAFAVRTTGDGGGRRDQRPYESVNVFEVVRDRNGATDGRWGAFGTSGAELLAHGDPSFE